MTSRRELRLALALCLAGAAAVLVGVSATWLTYRTGGDSVRVTSHAVSGADASAVTRALGVVGLVGVLALAATRSWGRAVVGVLLLLAGAGVVASVLAFLTRDVDGLVADDCRRQPQGCLALKGYPDGPTLGDRRAAATLVPLAGGSALALGGGLVAVRGRRWAALGASYEAPGAPVPSAPATDKQVWDALDRGDDPTA